MRTLPVPGAQLAPLDRGRNDGIGRLARRTQRGQGRRRLLVAGLIALSVLLGVGSAVFAATMIRSDETVLAQDRFGDAEAVVGTHVGGSHTDGEEPLTAADLTPAQREWLAAHAIDGAVPTGPTPGDLPLEVRQALGMEPLTVDPAEVLAEVQLPADDVLVHQLVQTWDPGAEEDRWLTTLDVTHPLAGTTYVTDLGARTSPLRGDEGLLSPTLLTALDARVGDTVDLPDVGTVEVVGTATRSRGRSDQVAVLAPGRDLSTWLGTEVLVRFASLVDAEAYETAARRILDAKTADLPTPTAEQRELAGIGEAPQDAVPSAYDTLYLDDRASWQTTFGAETGIATIVGGTVSALATVVAAVVGACAFAVGIRRRIREIGMLGAIGASPAQLRRLLRREGLVIGLSGAVVGAIAGLVLSFAALPLVERSVDRNLDVVVPAVGALLPVVVGAMGAFLAAVWPARTAARVPVTTALAGRVPLGRVPRWLPVAGAAAAVLGIALLTELVVSDPSSTGMDAVQLLVAILLATLGTATLGVPVVELGGRIADRLPLLGRLALRDAARQRTRSAAAVAALVPVMALPIAGLTVWHSEQARFAEGRTDIAVDGQAVESLPWIERGGSTLAVVEGPHIEGRQAPPSDDLFATVTNELPAVRDRAPLPLLGAPDLTVGAHAVLAFAADGTIDPVRADLSTIDDLGWVWGNRLALATPEVLALLDVPSEDVPTDGLLVLDGAGALDLPDDATELAVLQHAPEDDGTATDRTRDRLLGTVSVARTSAVSGGLAPAVLVAPTTAARLGLVEAGRSELVRLEAEPTRAQVSAVWEALGADTSGSVMLAAALPFWQTPLGVALIALLVAAAVTLAVSTVAGMTSALAATESDADVRKAVALGAAPSLRRRLHGLQAWWHSAIAAVLGTGLGLAVASAFVRSLDYTQHGPNGEVVGLIRTPLVVDWWALAGWVLVVPVLVGLVIAAVMRSAPVGAPRRRMG